VGIGALPDLFHSEVQEEALHHRRSPRAPIGIGRNSRGITRTDGPSKCVETDVLKKGCSMQILKKLLATFAGLMLLCGAALGQDKVVYHIDNAAMQATKGLRNIRNHLDVAPDTKIVVVTHAEGVDFLMEGARDAKNSDIDYGALVSALKARGVRFEICEITLRSRNLKKDQFTMDAEFTPSGVVRVARLQSREGHAYIKP